MRRRRMRSVVGALGAVAALVLAACGGGNVDVLRAGRRQRRRWRRPTAAANGVTTRPTEGRHAPLRRTPATGTPSTRATPTTATPGTSSALRPLAGHVQAGARARTAPAGPRPRQRLGKPSDGGKTWTYKLRKGLKFEDGTRSRPRTSSTASRARWTRTTFPNGPTYFNDFLDLQGYTAPYKDKNLDKLGLQGDRDAGRPDDRLPPEAAVLRLRLLRPAARRRPRCPQAKDTGTQVQGARRLHRPVQVRDQRAGQELRRWSATPTGTRRPTPNRQGAAGQIEVDARTSTPTTSTTGCCPATSTSTSRAPVCRPAAQGKILADPTLKANTDNADDRRASGTPRSTRRGAARQHRLPQGRRCTRPTRPATSAPTAAPPVATSPRACCRRRSRATQKIDLYPTPKPTRATSTRPRTSSPSAASRTASRPTSPTAPSARRRRRPPRRCSSRWPRSASSSTLKPLPAGDYFKLYAGKPDFVKANNLGLMINGWGADWPDGFGFLQQIVDSRVIRAGGNSNLGVKDPEVDALIDKARHDDRRHPARGDLGRRSTRRSWTTRSSCRASGPRACSTGRTNLTNVFVTDGFRMYDYLALGAKVPRCHSLPQRIRRQVKAAGGGGPTRPPPAPAARRARHTSSGGSSPPSSCCFVVSAVTFAIFFLRAPHRPARPPTTSPRATSARARGAAADPRDRA